MPLFMDVHENLPEGVTLQDVADAHAADVKIQEQHGVRYVRYWFAEEAGKIFCLAEEAPSAEAARAVHQAAHGLVADRIFEVEEGS